jgi:hypothetical protein
MPKFEWLAINGMVLLTALIIIAGVLCLGFMGG